MSELEEYNNFEEKSNFFYHNIIDTKEDLLKMFVRIDDIYYGNKDSIQTERNKKNINYYNPNIIFRGVNKAKYKLFNTIQRKWIQEEIYLKYNSNAENASIFDKFINENIENYRTNKNKLNEILNTEYTNERLTDIGLLSILQHNEFFTPLLDWSINYFIALYFSTLEINSNIHSDIDNYFSLYLIDTNKYLDNLPNFIFIKQLVMYSVYNLRNKYPKNDFNYVENIINIYNYNILKNHKLLLLSDWKYLVEENISVNTNQNILCQKGLFIFNNDPILPLENVFNESINKNIINIDGSPYYDQIKDKIWCFDIHNDLSSDIKLILEKKGINRKKLYPNEKD